MTQFELLTAAAFSELAERGVEAAVVEAGLGGRHDATNVLAAPVAVLTNVGLEHTRWLGPTITDIAREKLAVVAPGSTLVVGELDPEAEAEVAKVDARVVRADRPTGAVRTGDRAQVRAASSAANFAVAAGSRGASFLAGALDEAAVLRAASSLTVPGRFQITAEDPLTIFDGAHNPSGVAALAAALHDAVRRPAADRRALRARRQGRRGHAARARAARGRRRLHRQPQPARAQPGDARVAVEPARRAAGRDRGATRAPPSKGLATLAGEDGAVVATGSIYLVADLLSEPGRRRASAL